MTVRAADFDDHVCKIPQESVKNYIEPTNLTVTIYEGRIGGPEIETVELKTNVTVTTPDRTWVGTWTMPAKYAGSVLVFAYKGNVEDKACTQHRYSKDDPPVQLDQPGSFFAVKTGGRASAFTPPRGKIAVIQPSPIYTEKKKDYCPAEGISGLMAIRLLDKDKDVSGGVADDTFAKADAIQWSGKNSVFKPLFGQETVWTGPKAAAGTADIILLLDDDGHPAEDGGAIQVDSRKIYITAKPVYAAVSAVLAVDADNLNRKSATLLRMVQSTPVSSRKATLSAIRDDTTLPWRSGEPTWSGDKGQATDGLDSFPWQGRIDAEIGAVAGGRSASVQIDLLDKQLREVNLSKEKFSKLMGVANYLAAALGINKKFADATIGGGVQWWNVDENASPEIDTSYKLFGEAKVKLGGDFWIPGYSLNWKYVKAGLYFKIEGALGVDNISIERDGTTEPDTWKVPTGSLAVGVTGGVGAKIVVLEDSKVFNVDVGGEATISVSGAATITTDPKPGLTGQIELGTIEIDTWVEVTYKDWSAGFHPWKMTIDGYKIPKEPGYIVDLSSYFQ
jgi:hypothetical protein